MAGHQRPSYNLRLGMITSHFQTYIIWLVVIPNIWPDCVWLQHHLLFIWNMVAIIRSWFVLSSNGIVLCHPQRSISFTTFQKNLEMCGGQRVVVCPPPKMKSFAPILGVFIFWIKSPCWLDLSLSNQIRSNVIYSYNIIIWYMYTYST